MNKFNLTVKPIKTALNIAAALNYNKAGAGDVYMSGYLARKLTETAATKAQKGVHYGR